MRLHLMFFLSVAMASTILMAQKPEPQEVGGKIDWVYDYQDAKRISLESGRPMFVVLRCER